MNTLRIVPPLPEQVWVEPDETGELRGVASFRRGPMSTTPKEMRRTLIVSHFEIRSASEGPSLTNRLATGRESNRRRSRAVRERSLRAVLR